MRKTNDRVRPVGRVLVMAVLLVLPASVRAQSGAWVNPASGNWSDTNSWSGGIVADGVDSTADFSSIDITNDVTVYIDSARTNGSLIFGDAATTTPAGWILDNGDIPANMLSLEGGTPAITVHALGSGKGVTIRVPLQLPTGTTINMASEASLLLSGTITSPGSSGLNKTGQGVLNVTGQLFSSADPGVREIKVTQGAANFANTSIDCTTWVTGPGNDNAYVSVTDCDVNIRPTDWWAALWVSEGSGVGSYAMHGGTLTVPSYIEIAAWGGGALKGILSLDRGAQVNTSWMDIGDGNAASGTVVVRDTTTTLNCSGSIWVGVAQGFCTFNQLGGSVTVAEEVRLHYRMGSRGTCWGIYNLNGGILTTATIASADGDTKFSRNNAYVNFHGGTLSPGGSSQDFIHSEYADPRLHAPQLFVYAEGAVIDTAGYDTVVHEPLLAPPGQGVTNGTIPLAVTHQGAGYLGPPVIRVQNAGDTTGAAATAVADMVDDGSGNGTFKIESITITNPGINYTNTPTLEIFGGDSTTSAVLPVLAIATNVSGGLTKLGAGTLTLSATNSYTGDTRVEAGTLALGVASLCDTSEVHLAPGATLALEFDGEDVIRGLYYDNAEQPQGYYHSGDLGGAIRGSGSGFLNVTKGRVSGILLIVR